MVAQIALGAALALPIAWLVLTWWNTPEEHTFKAVVQHALRDVREIFAPAFGFAKRVWLFAAPRITNLVGVTVISLDAFIVQNPDLRAALLHDHNRLGLGLLLAINIAAQLSPKGAPDRVPPPSGGLVNNAALETK